jgi:Putative peptidoglycan binding domain
MATGRATQRDRDLDDWFAEPDQVLHQTHRPLSRAEPRAEPRAEARAGSHEDVGLESKERVPPLPVDDDWLTAEPRRELTRPKVARLAQSRARIWVAIGALVVLVAVGLAVSGVFSNSKAPATAAPPSTSQTKTTGKTQTSTTPKTPSRAKVVQPTTTLKPGQTGAQVRLLQRALTTLGYRPGKIDGRYGPATQRAVIRFQQAEGLKADGVFGTKTKLALLHAAT